MDRKIICNTSVGNVGGTFLDWSILFLNGKNNFYHCATRDLKNLVNNPLTSINAHNHQRNHPIGFSQTKEYIDVFLDTPYDFLTLYPYPMYPETSLEELGLQKNQLGENNINQHVSDYRMRDFSNLCNYVMDIGANLIYIDNTLELYDLEIRTLDKLFLESQPAVSAAEVKEKIQTTFFSKSRSQWDSLGLTNIWDVRERMALDSRPFQQLKPTNIDFNKQHCYITSQEWLTNGIPTIKKIMKFCQLNIDASRWNQWTRMYQLWQEKSHRALDFCYTLPHIIKAIIDDLYYEIDLTFDQEVVVQHCLIYHHNLNLKTWQLEKFPGNTRELHKLLECNIHPLGDV